MSDFKWTDHRMDGTAKRMGQYPWQFFFDQNGEVFHHHTATDRHRDFACKDDAADCDSDMTFAAAIMDTLKGEKEPCPECLGEFPTSLDELEHSHFPDPCSISLDRVRTEIE